MFRQGQRDPERKKKLHKDETASSTSTGVDGSDLVDPLLSHGQEQIPPPPPGPPTDPKVSGAPGKGDSSFTKEVGTSQIAKDSTPDAPNDPGSSKEPDQQSGTGTKALDTQKSGDGTATKVGGSDPTKVGGDLSAQQVGPGGDQATQLKPDSKKEQAPPPPPGNEGGSSNGGPEVSTDQGKTTDKGEDKDGGGKGLDGGTGGGGDGISTDVTVSGDDQIGSGDGSDGTVDGTTVDITDTSALLTGPPQLGITPLALIGSAVPDGIADSIKQETGKTVDDHFKSVSSDLAKVNQLATTLQASVVELAASMGAEVASWLGTQGGTIAGAAEQARGQIGIAFADARSQVDTAASTAYGVIAGAEKTAQSNIIAAADRNAAKAQKLYDDQSKAYTALHAELLKPFAEAYKAAAGTTRTDGGAVANRYDTLGKDVDAYFAKGGDALDTYLGKIRAEFAKKKLPSAKTDMGKGVETRAKQVEGQTEASSKTITALLAPMATRLAEIGTQAKAAVATARKGAEDKLAADVSSGKATIAQAQTSANEQLTADEQAARTEIDNVAARHTEEIATRQEGVVGMYESTGARFAEEYRQYVDQAATQIPQGQPITEEAGRSLVDGMIGGLESLHGEHEQGLIGLKATTEQEMAAGIQASLDGLGRVVDSASTEANTLAQQKVLVIDEVAQGFQGAFNTLAGSIDVSLDAWAAPITKQLADHISQVRTKLATMLTLTQAQLQQGHLLWKQEQESVVSAYCKTIEPSAFKAARESEKKVDDRAKQAFQAMRGLGTDENKLFDALRGMADGEAAATKQVFQNRVSGGGALGTWIYDEFFNDFEHDQKGYDTAMAHLDGNHALAARLEIAYNVNWYGDDEAQIEKVLRGLPEKEREKIASSDEWASTRKLLTDNLDGNDLKVTDALIANNVAKADAIRLKEKIDKARRQGDKDSLHDALAGMDQEQIDKIASEFVQLEGVSKVKAADGAQAREMMAGYVTRDIQQGGGRGGTYTNKLKSHDADLAKALIVNGKDSTEAKISRFEVEMKRPGGPKEEKLESALLADGDLKERLHSNDSKVRDAAKQELATQQQKFKEQYTAKYGKDAGKAIEGMTAVDGDKRDLYGLMLKDGYNTPEVAEKQIKLAVNGLGTDEDAIKRALGGMSPADIKALKARYPNLEKDLGVNDHKGFGSELSGQDRFDVEILLMGDEKHMNDDERYELASKKYDQQRGSESTDTSRAMFGGSVEGEQLEKNWDDLKTFRKENKAKFKDGKFVGTPEEYEEYARLCRYVGISSELYQEQIDRVANGITTGLAIAGAVIASVATGGAAAPVLAALIAGVGSMGVNAALKGGRYGWEDATKDGAITIVSAVTAGVGAKFAAANEGATVFNVASKGGQTFTKAGIAGGQGAINNMATTAMDDKTWKDGIGSGLGETFYQGGKGALVGLASKGGEELLGGIKPLEKALKSTSGFTRGSAKSLASGVSGMAGKTTELTYDTIGGKFDGDLDKWAKEIGFEGGKSAFQGMLEGHGEAFQERRKASSSTSGKSGDDASKKQEDLTKFAEESGKQLDVEKTKLMDDANKLDADAQKLITKEDGKEVKQADGKEDQRTATAKKLDDQQKVLNDQQEQVVTEIEVRQTDIEQTLKKTQEQTDQTGKVDEQPPVTTETKPKTTPQVEEVTTVRGDDGEQVPVVKDKTVSDDTQAVIKKTVSEDAAKKLPSDLTDAELSEVQRRVKSGESEDAVIKSMLESRSSSTSTSTSDSEPSANKVMSDDQLMTELQRLQKAGKVDEASALKVLDGDTPEKRHEALVKLKQDIETDATNRQGYPKELIDAQKTPEPTAKAKLVQEAVDSFKKGGQQAAVDALERLAGNVDAQAELAHHLAVYKSVITKDVASITDAELISLVRAHTALAASTGADDAVLRKFVDQRMMEGMLSMKGRGGEDVDKLLLGGCVGDAKNTVDLTAEEAIKALGLDYSWKNKDGSLGVSPFVQDNGNGNYTAQKEAHFVEFPVTSEIAAKAQVTVKSELYERIAALAASGDADAQQLMTRLKPHDPYDPTNALDPYTGTGGTAAGGLLGKGSGLTLNQEMHIGAPAAMPHGSKMYKLDAKGQKILIGTYLVDGSGKGSWAMANP